MPLITFMMMLPITMLPLLLFDALFFSFRCRYFDAIIAMISFRFFADAYASLSPPLFPAVNYYFVIIFVITLLLLLIIDAAPYADDISPPLPERYVLISKCHNRNNTAM